MSCEEAPRIVTLAGDAVAGVNHAYGTTGIITALTLAMAPAQPWMDLVAGFGDFGRGSTSSWRWWPGTAWCPGTTCYAPCPTRPGARPSTNIPGTT